MTGSKEYCEQKEDEILSDDNDRENNDEIDVHGVGKEGISEKKKENSNGKLIVLNMKVRMGMRKIKDLQKQLVKRMAQRLMAMEVQK